MTPHQAAPGKKPKGRVGGLRPGHPPPGGKRRSRAEVARLLDVCEEGVLLGLPLYQIRSLMGKAIGRPGPISKKTACDYVARVRARHEANPLPDLAEARLAAERRYQKMIAALVAGGRDKNAAKILAWETRLAALRGMDAPRDKEAIEAAALAIIQDKIQRVRQEREAAATLQEDAEARKQRAIDVAEVVPPERNGHG